MLSISTLFTRLNITGFIMLQARVSASFWRLICKIPKIFDVRSADLTTTSPFMIMMMTIFFTKLNHPLLYLFNQLFLPVNLTQTRKHSSRMRTARLPTIRKGGAVLKRSGGILRRGAVLKGAILRGVPQEVTSSTPPVNRMNDRQV